MYGALVFKVGVVGVYIVVRLEDTGRFDVVIFYFWRLAFLDCV